MRIFQVLSKRMSYGVSHDKGWLRNLYEPLIDLGHDVYLFEYSSFNNKIIINGLGKDNKKELNNEIIDQFEREHKKQPFDLFFSYLTDRETTSDLPQYINSMGVPTLNFSCNNTHQFHTIEKISPHFTYNLHSEKNAAEKFREIDANPIWFPMAANPKYYQEYSLEKEFDVTFVGQNYALRPYYINHLLDNGIDVNVWGSGWREKEDLRLLREIFYFGKKYKDISKLALTMDRKKSYYIASQLAYLEFRNLLQKKYTRNFHHPLSDNNLVKMYSQSKISLGFVEVWDHHQPGGIERSHVHLREFEAPMSGALYCTGYTEELNEFYELDKEIIVYRCKSELLDKVKFYLSHPVEAERIRVAGYERALKCHTYQKRYEDLFSKIKLR